MPQPAKPDSNAPDRSPVALIIIDMINDLEFEGGDQLLTHALPVVEAIAALKQRARAAAIPVIYANDNFGRWRSDLRDTVEHCLHDNVRGQRLAQRLKPSQEDYFVLKPKHSAFFSTTLDTLLRYLGACRLILTGIAGDNCVLITAVDAYLRDFELIVPADCLASISDEENGRALAYMQRVLHATTTASSALDLDALHARPMREA